MRFNYLSGSQYIAIKVDVACIYADICRLAEFKEYSFADILNLFFNSAHLSTLEYSKYNSLDPCMFFSGFGKANASENKLAFPIFIAHHNSMIIAVLLVVALMIGNSMLFLASKWLHIDIIRSTRTLFQLSCDVLLSGGDGLSDVY